MNVKCQSASEKKSERSDSEHPSYLASYLFPVPAVTPTPCLLRVVQLSSGYYFDRNTSANVRLSLYPNPNVSRTADELAYCETAALK